MKKQYKLFRPIERKVRFNQEENEYINRKIDKSPFTNFQNFARVTLINKEITLVDFTALETLNREVNRVGNNINQIAKVAHQFQEVSQEDILDLISEVKELQTLVSNKFNSEIKSNKVI